jgi:hypothetical protein
MKHFVSIIFLLMAACAVFFGVKGTEFRLGGLGRTPTSKPLPIWFGRLWFFGFAIILLYLGIIGLR